MRCPDCDGWLDMRDLADVFRHQHYMEEKLVVSFSHATKQGIPGEVYCCFKGRMVPLASVIERSPPVPEEATGGQGSRIRPAFDRRCLRHCLAILKGRNVY